MKQAAVADRIVPWMAFPSAMLIGIALHAWLQQSASSVLLSAYVVVIMVAVMVTLLERYYPYYDRWRPASEAVRQDVAYMVVVQMLLPKLLSLLFVFALITPLGGVVSDIHHWWPHQQPIAVQVVLMVLAADFMRYWLHRASHKYSLLWRLHAVHHSPLQLYWLNVGRFHPIEKGLQFLFDALPFMLLGVSELVIAYYFVFYAINGFFQHSNIELRYGVLNYLFSSAELHRWHHSVLPAESNTNFGNNTILWDLLFGTWFLPRGRRISEIGLKNRLYPQGFIDQMKTPFTSDIIDREVPLQGIGQKFQQLLICLRMQLVYWLDIMPVSRAAARPDETQEAVLLGILGRNVNTRFGLEHKFSTIGSAADYAKLVPARDYESLRTYIDEQDTHKTPALTQQQPLFYAVTSGTTGQAKYIPVLPLTLRQFRREQRIYSWVQHQYSPEAFDGKVLCFAGAAREGTRQSGTPYGSISGYLYKSMPALVRRNYVVPAEVFEIQDYTLKYKVMLRLALAERNVTFLAGANATSFLRLLTLLNESTGELIESLTAGGFEALRRVNRRLHSTLLPGLSANPARAAELRALADKPEITFADLWPNLRLLSVWTGGSCGVALRALRLKLPGTIKVMDLGYMSSELRATVTIDPETGAGVPTFQHAYFEFVPVSAWQNETGDTLTLGQLREGQDYYVIVTTASGLYRYKMHDVIRVIGRYKNTPTIVFLRKGKGVTSITGEKLYEDQLLKAMSDVQSAFGFVAAFFVMLANEEAGRYQLYVESKDIQEVHAGDLCRAIDAQLSDNNIEYRAKRDSGRLLPLTVNVLRSGSGEAYKRHCVAMGQREGQFKVMALQYMSDVKFDFNSYLY